MRRVVQDKEGNTLGTIGDECVTAHVGPVVVPDTRDRNDLRDDQEKSGTVLVSLNLTDARILRGRRVAIFTIEEVEQT